MRSHVLVIGRDAEVGARRSTPIDRVLDSEQRTPAPIEMVLCIQ